MGSIPIARFTSGIGQVTWGYQIGVSTLILWETVGNGRRGGDGLMASRIPVLRRDSHVPSHAAVHKNNLCDSHSLCVAAIAIAGGRTPTPLQTITTVRYGELCFCLITARKCVVTDDVGARRLGNLLTG